MLLYHSGNSYASQKVRIYLAEKGIAWKSYHIDLLKQEHITDRIYRTIHPRGLVPALKDGTSVICNSTEIMEYLEAHYVRKAIPMDLKLMAEIHNFCKKDEELHDPHIRTLSYYHLWVASEPSSEEKNRVLAIAANHPDRARGDFLARAIQRQITEQELANAKRAIIGALEDLERRLANSSSGFLFGNEYTMADSVATARLFRLERLGFRSVIEEKYPRTLAYYNRMKGRHSFEEINKSYGKDTDINEC